ncbi:PA2169 family four-helix-bundle protein [Mucilaginibacter xinganensis]|uniref:Aldehyde dehydrogenase n=1 Tax=Mucilaginibacter xinganensis TaxID=1234841 RepID=A0A223NV29_9SPHI|nr:PA2169 family four-helix-bundle protein [Mucilaginibacter xinganensis]ASU33381.1 aldehyde dehydrogenase [Mucilaginibacter xinganensis]
METTTEMTTEILNDLIAINNDRITGYERAAGELKEEDADLRALFTDMVAESHQCKMELANEVAANGGDIEQGTTTSGKIYRAWMDVKAVFTGHDRKTVLENCEAGEDAAQKAYTTALREEELPAYIRTMISKQKEDLKVSHDKIKNLRDFQS